MDNNLPTANDVRQALLPLTMRQIERLANLSGVPAATIYKIKRGETTNPGIDTVGKFLLLVSEAANKQAA